MPNNNELVPSGRKIALTGTSWTLQIDAVDAVASPAEGDDATLANVRCSVGSVATTGKLTRAGHLVVDVSASVKGASEALDLAGAGELGPEFTALKAQCADLLTRALSSCEVAVRPGTGDLAYVRVGVKTGEPALSWRILGEHALTLGDVTLAVIEPHDEWLRRFEATLSARLAVGEHAFTFALANARTAANPRGIWRLAQTAPTTFRSIVALVGAAELADDLPDWARRTLDNTAVTGLALALDLPACSVYSLSGGLEFHKIPILGLTDEQGRIDRIGLDLAVDDPFSAAQRRLHFWFNGEATILGHKFTLAGGKSGRSWTIAAGYVGRISLTDALGRLLGDVPALFDDFDLSLIDPTVAIDDAGFSFACGVAIARDQPVSVGIGALVFSGGRIEFGRRSGATIIRLRASLGLVVADGPKLDRLALSFDHEGDKATTATLDAALELPVAGQKPVVVTLTGGYTAGKHGGFELVGTCKDLSLRTIADALGAGPLPDEFPELTLTSVRVEVDSRKQLFRVKGRVAAGTFTLADRQIEGSSLEVGFATSKTEDRRTTEFSVEGKTRIGDTTCKFKLKAEPRGTTASVIAEGKISIADLLRTCGVNVDSGAGDEQIEGAGFDYESVTCDKKGDDKQPDDKQPDVPRRRFELHARGSGDKWRIALVLARFDKDPYEKLLLVRFADVSRLKGAELRWSTRARTLTLHDKTTERFPGGPAGRVTLALAGTRVAALLKQDELPLEFDARGLRRSDTDPPGALPVGHSDARAPAKSDTVEPADGDAGVSLGGVVTVRNMRLGGHATPRPALTFAADIGLQIGPWVSIAVQQARVTITPTSLSLAGLAASGVDFDLDGAAVVVKLPPWLRAGAAIVKQGDAAADILRVSGLGELDLLGKLKIRAFVDLGFGRDAQRRRVLTDAFAFVCASGFALGTPAITVTGLAGGLGYNRVLTLPARPQEVASHPAIALLRGDPGDGDPALVLLDQLGKFKDKLHTVAGAWCVAFGATFKVAALLDVTALMVLELRDDGFDLGLAGVADLPLRLGGDATAPALGHVQLGLVARYGSASGTLAVLGALTDASWLLDRACKLRGGFALCMWFTGPHRGDFVVSLGGYSPLAPVRSHYPALDRVGFAWKPAITGDDVDLSLSGDLYLALDRHGVQFGVGARLRYTSPSLSVQAHFALDTLIDWAPLAFEATLKIGVHVEIRAFITLRLDFDVDMHAWGPPFGATIHVAIDLMFVSLSATVAVGARRFDRPRATLDDVLALARAGAPTALAIAGPGLPSDPKLAAILRADAIDLAIALAVPATAIVPASLLREATALALDIRPLRRKAVRSELRLTLVHAGEDRTTRGWRVDAAITRPAEALWFLPDQPDDPASKFLESPHRAITGLRIRPPPATPAGAPRSVPLAPHHVRRTIAAVAAGSVAAALRDALARVFDLDPPTFPPTDAKR